MAKVIINKFVAVNSRGIFIALGNDGYAYKTEEVEKALLCDDEHDAKRDIGIWINSYEEMFGQFKIVPVQISYDLDNALTL